MCQQPAAILPLVLLFGQTKRPRSIWEEHVVGFPQTNKDGATCKLVLLQVHPTGLVKPDDADAKIFGDKSGTKIGLTEVTLAAFLGRTI